MDPAIVSWPTCEHTDCIGIRVSNGQRCLAHCDDDERAAVLKVISETGEIDARGVTFSSTLHKQVMAAVPRNVDGRSVMNSCRFDQAGFDSADFREANFRGEAIFDGVTFIGDAEFEDSTFMFGTSFRGARFMGDAAFGAARFGGVTWFEDAEFIGDAEFGGASFRGAARFGAAKFRHEAGFMGAEFGGVARFDAAKFRRDAWFVEARFGGASFRGVASFISAEFRGVASFEDAKFRAVARFGDARFGGEAGFEGARFGGEAGFEGARFGGDAGFGGTVFRRNATFSGVTFERASNFGPVLVYRDLVLDDAEFARRARIEASAAVLRARRARFPSGVQFRLRWAQVVLDDADFPTPSTLSGISRLSDESLAKREEGLVEAWRRYAKLGAQTEAHRGIVEPVRLLTQRKGLGRPCLLSLRGANVAGLALNSLALDDCRFTGAHNLDKLRLEDSVSLSITPARLGRFNRDRRGVIAEESAWRASRSSHWSAPWWPEWIDGKPDVLEPGQTALLYRGLRKGREDNKDEPGAADFYYGEMEMRRHARRTGNSVGGSSRGGAERALLTAYWLISGYGLRAWRAIMCLGLASVAFALAFHYFGFRPSARPDSSWESLLYTFRTSLSLTDREFKLTSWGKLFQALLRIAGPVLLGLAALAFRGRVKR